MKLWERKPGTMDKDVLLATVEVDCSWCAMEMPNATLTNSPTICPRHDEMLRQQSAARQAAKQRIAQNYEKRGWR